MKNLLVLGSSIISIFGLILFMDPLVSLADVGDGVSYDDSSSSSDDGGLLVLLYFLIKHPYLLLLLIVVYFVVKKTTGVDLIKVLKKTRAELSENNSTNNNNRYNVDKKSIDKLKEKDPNFSDEAFISKVNNMFMQLQDSWMKKEWSTIRPFETDALFSMHERQLQRYIDRQQTNIMDNIGILNTEIVRFETEGNHDEIDVKIHAKFYDYIIDDQTEKVIKGDPNKEIRMTYIWTLIRKEGVLTSLDDDSTKVSQCPNCGANVSINQSGQCEYCDSVVSSGDYSWVLSKIRVLNQN